MQDLKPDNLKSYSLSDSSFSDFNKLGWQVANCLNCSICASRQLAKKDWITGKKFVLLGHSSTFDYHSYR